MRFVKFPSIENVANVVDKEEFARFVGSIDFSRKNDIPVDENWVVLEKIDGSNVSFLINKHEYKVAKRNSLIASENDLNAIGQSVHDFEPSIHKIQDSLKEGEEITLFGEYFGLGIQNRIFYGRGKYFRFFALVRWENDIPNFCSWHELEDFMKGVFGEEGQGMLAPVLAKTHTFQEALAVKNDGISTLTDVEHASIMEGTIIRPYNVSGYGVDADAIVKNKNDFFKEQRGISKTEELGDLVKMHVEFMQDYCVKNRMYSVFSKEGNPKSMSEIGKYIGLFLKDAIDDYAKDVPEIMTMDKKDFRYVTNIKSLGFKIFKEVVAEIGLDI